MIEAEVNKSNELQKENDELARQLQEQQAKAQVEPLKPSPSCVSEPMGEHRALCPRCAKSRLFSTTGSHGSQPRCCYTRDLFFFFSLMRATGPRVLNTVLYKFFRALGAHGTGVAPAETAETPGLQSTGTGSVIVSFAWESPALPLFSLGQCPPFVAGIERADSRALSARCLHAACPTPRVPCLFWASARAFRETQARCARDLVLFHECTVFSSRQNLVNTACQKHE